MSEITITISDDAAQWLRDEMGRRPAAEAESGEIFEALLREFAKQVEAVRRG